MVTTVNPGTFRTYHAIAGVDLTAHQYKAVRLSGTQVVLGNDTVVPLGVLQDAPALGKGANYVPHGFALAKVSGSISVNGLLYVAADGTLTETSNEVAAIGRAIEAGSDGDTLLVWIGPALAPTGGGGITGRKSDADLGGSVSGAVSADFDGGSYDNKTFTLTGDATISVDASRGGVYGISVKSDSTTQRNITWVFTSGTLSTPSALPPFVDTTDGFRVDLFYDETNWYVHRDLDQPNVIDGTSVGASWAVDADSGMNFSVTGQLPSGVTLETPSNLPPGPILSLDFDEAQLETLTLSSSFVLHGLLPELAEPGSGIAIRKDAAGTFHLYPSDAIDPGMAATPSPGRKNSQDILSDDTSSIDFDTGSYDFKQITFTANSTLALTATRQTQYRVVLKSSDGGVRQITLPSTVKGLPGTRVYIQGSEASVLMLDYDGTNFHVL